MNTKAFGGLTKNQRKLKMLYFNEKTQKKGANFGTLFSQN
jgi:hypothetical protein